MQQEALLGFGADAGNLAQGALDGRFGAQVAVEGDAEAVGFVANLLQYFQRARVAVDEQRIRVPYADDFLQALRQAHYRELVREPQLGQGLPGGVQLAAAAVDYDQIRQIVRSLCQHPRVAPVHHFFHRGEVVGADHGLYLELAIILLGGLCVAENDAGRHGIRALDVGVVEALDVLGEPVHRQRLLQLLHHGQPPRIRVSVLLLLDGIEVELLGVLGAELQQGQFVAARGHRERHPVNRHIRQERHNHLRSQRPELILNFADKSSQEGRWLLLDLAAEAKVQALNDSPAADAQEVPVGLAAIQNDGKHIGSNVRGRCHHALGIMLLHGLHLLLVQLRLLEIELRGCIGH